MEMNRKQFLILATAMVAGCRSANFGGGSNATQEERVVDAGPVGNYAVDGLYAGFRDQGFFVIREGTKLFALAAICTHRKCKLTALQDHSFYCDCHGSTFDPDGKVTEGPAKRDLPVLPSFMNESGRLFVKVPAG